VLLTAAELIVLQRETGQTLAAGQTVSRACDQMRAVSLPVQVSGLGWK
jgi:hypothetical protein